MAANAVLDFKLVNLIYTPPKGIVGAGRMTIQLAVSEAHHAVSGQATGTILEGTLHSPHFAGGGLGKIYSTGFNGVTKVGGVQGQAFVLPSPAAESSAAPPVIVPYLAPFSADFAVDNDWVGTGTFSVGPHTYHCEVTKVE